MHFRGLEATEVVEDRPGTRARGDRKAHRAPPGCLGRRDLTPEARETDVSFENLESEGRCEMELLSIRVLIGRQNPRVCSR